MPNGPSPIGLFVVAWVAHVVAPVVIAWGLRFRSLRSEFRRLAPPGVAVDEDPRVIVNDRRMKAFQMTSQLGPFFGLGIAIAWSTLVGVRQFPTDGPDVIDGPRFVVWTAVLILEAIVWGGWVWRRTPDFPRLFWIGIAIVVCWGVVVTILGPA